jgi:hypothetical protein
MGKYATIIHDFSPKENHHQVDFFAKKAKCNEKNISRTKNHTIGRMKIRRRRS